MTQIKPSADTQPSVEQIQQQNNFFQWIKAHKLATGLALVSVSALGAGTYFWKVPMGGNITHDPIAVGEPDIWLHSQNFSKLPQHILSVPLLGELLNEDFLFFYQQNSDWLGLKGTFRRITFEHELTLKDSMIEHLADAPADMYFWRDGSNAYRYWAMSVERDALSSFAQALAKLKLNADKQLKILGELSIDGDKVTVYQVTLSATRQLVVTNSGKRWAVLSSPKMVSFEDGKLLGTGKDLLEQLLSEKASKRDKLVGHWQSSKPQSLQSPEDTIWLSKEAIHQGYAKFVPSMNSIRFDFVGNQWLTHAELDSKLLASATQALWQTMPNNAGFCANSPMDWQAVQKVTDPAKLKDLPALSEIFSPDVLVCWYASKQDKLNEPLFAFKLKNKSGLTTQQATALFNWSIATDRTYLQPVTDARIVLRRAERSLELSQKELADAKKALKDEEKSLKKYKPEDDVYKNLQDNIEWSKNNIIDNEKIVSDNQSAVEKAKTELAKAQEAIKAPAEKAKEVLVTPKGAFTQIARTQALQPKTEKKELSNPILSFNDEVVYFSSKPHLIKLAEQTAQQQFPNLYEATALLNGSTTNGSKSTQFLYVEPAKLSKLLDQTSLSVLKKRDDAILTNAYQYHMPEKQAVLQKTKPFTLSLGAKASGTTEKGFEWYQLTWQQ